LNPSGSKYILKYGGAKFLSITEAEKDMAIARYLEIAAQIPAELPVPLDRLPYTPEFDMVYLRFTEISGTTLSQHDVWWFLLGARKRGLVRAMRRHRSGKS
jgi:hypothetical protein